VAHRQGPVPSEALVTQLSHYRLAPAQPGRYRIRREPQLDYLSTIEAIVAALRILDA